MLALHSYAVTPLRPFFFDSRIQTPCCCQKQGHQLTRLHSNFLFGITGQRTTSNRPVPLTATKGDVGPVFYRILAGKSPGNQYAKPTQSLKYPKFLSCRFLKKTPVLSIIGARLAYRPLPSPRSLPVNTPIYAGRSHFWGCCTIYSRPMLKDCHKALGELSGQTDPKWVSIAARLARFGRITPARAYMRRHILYMRGIFRN